MKKHINEMITAIVFVIGVLFFMRLLFGGGMSPKQIFTVYQVLSIATAANFMVYLILCFRKRKEIMRARVIVVLYHILYSVLNIVLFLAFFSWCLFIFIVY